MKNRISDFFEFKDSNDKNMNDIESDSIIAELNKLKDEDPISFNMVSEKYFHKYLCKLIDEFNNRLYKNEAINEIAFALDISTATARRYFAKHTTRRAQFFIKDKIVHCKIHDHEA